MTAAPADGGRPDRVALLLVATGRYRGLLPAVVTTARRHLAGLDQIFVFSDEKPGGTAGTDVTWLPWGHLRWPYPTLLRYRAFTAYQDVLHSASLLLYSDVDMRFVRDVDIRSTPDTVAVIHPGCGGTPADRLPYERRPESTSAMSPGTGERYYAGGVQGGRADRYLAACATIAGWLQADLDRGVIPVWHDESAWNRYCALNPPGLVLSSDYCTPEQQENEQTRIVALDKHHDRLRQTPHAARIAARARVVRGGVRRRLSAAVHGIRKVAG
jgi:histo-blood group ABO system transferase